MQTGKVKHYNSEKGYGFIDIDNQKEDVFFHISVWQLSQQPSVGQQVYLTSAYLISANNKKQLRATQVSASPITATPQPSPKQPPKPMRVNQSRHTSNNYSSRNKKSGLSNAIISLVVVVAIVFGAAALFKGKLGGVLDTVTSAANSHQIPSSINDAIHSSSTDILSPYQKTTVATVTGDAQIDQTIALIKKGGPFPYPNKDGTTFYNREGLLPKQSRGYYREYTVPTPGVSHRGARRIVTGGNPPTVYYLTVDHYNSFSKLDVN